MQIVTDTQDQLMQSNLSRKQLMEDKSNLEDERTVLSQRLQEMLMLGVSPTSPLSSVIDWLKWLK